MKLDKRIIEDLSKNNTIKDVRLLRIIRKADVTNEDGYSDIQYSLYKKVINENLSRAELSLMVKRKKNKDSSPIHIKRNQKSYDIKFHTGKLSDQQAEEFEKIINENLQVFLKEIVGIE